MPDAALRSAGSRDRLFLLLLGGLLAITLFAGGARAADESELKQLQALLSVINQELTAAYQQYQMASEARGQALQNQMNDYLVPPEVQQYEDVKKRQRDAVRRDREMADQMDRILAQIRELESQKKPVLERIYELLRERAPPSASPPAQPAPAGGY